MVVTDKTTYHEALPFLLFLTDKSRADLEEKAVERFGCFEALSIERFSAIVASDLTPILGEGWNTNPTLFQYMWCEYAKREMEGFVSALERYAVPETPEEKVAAEGLPSVTLIEGLLVFAQSYFGCRSFSEAAEISLGEVKIAKKAEYRRVVMQRKLDRIQSDKFKKK